MPPPPQRASSHWRAGLWAMSNGRGRSARRRWRARTRPLMRPPARPFTSSSPSTSYSAATLRPSGALRRLLSTLLGDRQSGMTGLQEALPAYLGQGNKLLAPLFQGLLAELEAGGEDAEGALREIDEALALANETGERWTDALLNRLRGEILLKRDPANTAQAEAAFLAAIAVAQ